VSGIWMRKRCGAVLVTSVGKGAGVGLISKG
jgi:hypothetical protein